MKFDIDTQDIEDRTLAVYFNQRLSNDIMEQIRVVKHVDDVAFLGDVRDAIKVLVDDRLNNKKVKDSLSEGFDGIRTIIPPLRDFDPFS